VSSGPVGPLNAAGQFDATAFSFTVTAAVPRAFRANYLGDPTYAPSQGLCEPLQVVDANIQVTPASAFNEIGTNHTITGHVNVNAGQGAGFVNAPDGTVITFTFVSGSPPTTFVGPNTCTTAGGTGSCTVVITSPSAVVATVHAATDVSVGGITIHRETNGLGLNSGNAVKQFEDANIQISPLQASNEIGTNHTLTGHVNVNDGTGFVNAPAGTTINFTLTNGNGATAAFVGPNSCTTVGATGSCTVVISSPTPGTTSVHATTDVTVNGVSLHRETNGVGANSGDANKNWVDANIQITPQNATNPVNTNHTLTGHVNVNDGTGFVNAPAGTVITFSLSNAGGATATFVGPSSCTTVGATGSCTVVISSPTAGTTTINASTNVTVGGVSLTRTTNGVGANSGPATKIWQNPQANIQITPPTASNEIGTNHTLTGHVNVSIDGVNFTNAPAGTVINFTLANSNGATAAFVGPASCSTVGATGSCTVVISSPTPGSTTIHASSDPVVSGVTLHVETNGQGANSGDANKNWVDANIQITPANATNPVGTNHTLTGHVNVNPGNGFVNAPDGTVITFALSNAGGATAVFVGPSSCTTAGGTGSCTVVISSPTAGTTTVNASTTVSVNGVSLTRTTNGVGANSGPATKIWLQPAANIQISPPTATNEIGTNHTLTGHVNVSTDGVNFTNAPAGTLITFTKVSGPGTFVGPSTCTTVGATGSCTVVITSATPGTTVVHAASDPVVSGVTLHVETNGVGANSGDANKTWVDANIQITPQTASNPTGTNHTLTGHVNVNPGNGFVNAPDGTVITFTLSNAGGATAVFVGPSSCTTAGGTGSCTVVISSPTGGTTTINASSTVTVGGVSLTRTTNGTGGNSGPATKTWIPPGGQITPTNVDCNDILNNTAPTLDGINYPSNGGRIGQGINPGVFFYWVKITVPAGVPSITVSQSNNSTNNAALFQIHQGWIRLYQGDCSSWTQGTQNAAGTGGTFAVTPGQSYIIGIKYNPKSIVGTPVPVPSTITYTFTTSLGATTDAKVVLRPQH